MSWIERWKLQSKRRNSPRGWREEQEAWPALLRLEDRRVLDASFGGVVGHLLLLDNFTQAANEDLTMSEAGTDYTFTLSEGVWNGVDLGLIQGAGTNTLSVNKALLDGYATGILVDDSNAIDVDIDFQDTNADQIAVDLSAAAGSLELRGVGVVSQSAEVVLPNLTASPVSMTLTDADNDFGSVNLTSLNDVQLRDANQLAIAAADVGTNLSLTVGGDLTQTGSIHVNGSTSFVTSGASTSIRLQAFSNQLDGPISATGALQDFELRNGSGSANTPTFAAGFRNLTLVYDAAGIDLSTLSLSGDLSLSSSATITQSGTWTVAGDTTLETLSATSDILLSSQPNDFSGSLNVQGTVRDLAIRNINASASLDAVPTIQRDLTLSFDNADLQLPSVQVLGDLQLTSGGNVTQTGPLLVSGGISISALTPDSNVVLDNAANDFAGSFSITGDLADLSLRNQNAGAVVPVLLNDVHNLTLTFDNADMVLHAAVVTGDLSVIVGGDLSQSGGLVVSGDASFEATSTNASISLDHALNDFNGSVTILGDVPHVTFRDSTVGAAMPVLPSDVSSLSLVLDNSDIQLPSIVVLADMSAVAGGTITNGGGAIIDVQGNASLQGTSITLGNGVATVDFGSLTVNATANVDVSETSDMILAGTSSAVQVDLQSTGSIRHAAGASLIAASTNLVATDGIGDAGGLPLQVGTITATTTSGNVELANVSDATTGPVSLTVSTGGGNILFQENGNQSLVVNSAVTTAGDVEIRSVGDVTAHSVIAGDAKFGDGEILISAANIAVDELSAPSDLISLFATGGITEENSDAQVDVDGGYLSIDAAAGLGDPLDPLESDVGYAEVDGGLGGIALSNQSILRVVGSGFSATGGDIQVDASELQTYRSVTNSGGGDILLTTTSGGVRVESLIETSGGTGTITVTSAGTVRIGRSGLVKTTTGSVGLLPAKMQVTAAPQSGTSSQQLDGGGPVVAEATVDSNGFAQIFVWINDASGTNYDITIDWADVVEDYPPLSNGGNLGNGSGPPFNGRVVHGFYHTYVANPDLSNPAAPIPVHLTAEFDYRSGPANGIQFFGKGGVKIVLSASIDLIPPGEGIAWGITFPEALVSPTATPSRAEETSVDTNSAPSVPRSEFYATVIGSKSNATVERQLVLRVVSSSGEEGPDIPLDLQDLNNLPELFRRLPDNRYRIYLIQEDGTTRLVMDVSVRQGKVTDPSDTSDERAERPLVLAPLPSVVVPISLEQEDPVKPAAPVLPDDELPTEPTSQEAPASPEAEPMKKEDASTSSSAAVVVAATMSSRSRHPARWQQERDRQMAGLTASSLSKGRRLIRRLYSL